MTDGESTTQPHRLGVGSAGVRRYHISEPRTTSLSASRAHTASRAFHVLRGIAPNVCWQQAASDDSSEESGRDKGLLVSRSPEIGADWGSMSQQPRDAIIRYMHVTSPSSSPQPGPGLALPDLQAAASRRGGWQTPNLQMESPRVDSPPPRSCDEPDYHVGQSNGSVHTDGDAATAILDALTPLPQRPSRSIRRRLWHTVRRIFKRTSAKAL